MFDLNKIKSAAAKLGMEINSDSSNPGMHFYMPDGSVDVYTYDELKKSLDAEFYGSTSKMNLQYNLNTDGMFSINIKSQEKSMTSTTNINKIELTISGHNKISEKNETSFNDTQYMDFNLDSNSGAA